MITIIITIKIILMIINVGPVSQPNPSFWDLVPLIIIIIIFIIIIIIIIIILNLFNSNFYSF
jgi:hypothetical protein